MQESLDLFLKLLASRINELISTNFEKLVQILYRLDISEKKLKEMLKTSPEENAGSIIAILIWDRQMEKITLRKKFRHSEDIPEEDKW